MGNYKKKKKNENPLQGTNWEETKRDKNQKQTSSRNSRQDDDSYHGRVIRNQQYLYP